VGINLCAQWLWWPALPPFQELCPVPILMLTQLCYGHVSGTRAVVISVLWRTCTCRQLGLTNRQHPNHEFRTCGHGYSFARLCFADDIFVLPLRRTRPCRQLGLTNRQHPPNHEFRTCAHGYPFARPGFADDIFVLPLLAFSLPRFSISAPLVESLEEGACIWCEPMDLSTQSLK